MKFIIKQAIINMDRERWSDDDDFIVSCLLRLGVTAREIFPDD
jgi:hypothetical protein